MQVLALERDIPNISPGAIAEWLEPEAAKLWELHQAGVVRELYFRQDRSEAVLMLECLDLEEANEILGSLPLVRNGLIKFEIMPLRAYPGFARLFQ